MTDSKGSVVVSDQRALDGCADVVVVPDHGGEREDALPDPGEYAGWCSSAVLFQVELAFVGVEHRFDILTQWFEELSTRAGLFALASRSEKVDTGCGECGFEVAAIVVLVRDQGGTGDLVGQVGVVEHAQQHVAFIGFGAGDRGRDRQPVQRAQQVQPQPPEVAAVRGAVPVLGEAGQIRTLGGLPGTAALHGGGVGDPHVVAEHAGPGAQRADQPTQGADELAQPLVVPGLPGQVREQVPEVAAAERSQRASLVKPRRACATASVTSSASLIRGLMPTGGRHGTRSGLAFSRSSTCTYSAVTRVSRSASTRASCSTFW